jgi:hypothetical protein
MIPRRPDLEDLDGEIREHIEAETHDNVARGMSEEEARTAALRKFGNVARVKEDVRAVWMSDRLDQLRQDARDAVRYVRRNPAFSLTIVVTLALGIGLCTAIYSVVNAGCCGRLLTRTRSAWCGSARAPRIRRATS